ERKHAPRVVREGDAKRDPPLRRAGPGRRKGVAEPSASAIDAHQLAFASGLAQRRARLREPCCGRADEVDGPFDGRAAPKARLDGLLQLAHGVKKAAGLAAGARVVATPLGLGPEVAGAQL